jgi:hypothetical protein
LQTPFRVCRMAELKTERTELQDLIWIVGASNLQVRLENSDFGQILIPCYPFLK